MLVCRNSIGYSKSVQCIPCMAIPSFCPSYKKSGDLNTTSQGFNTQHFSCSAAADGLYFDNKTGINEDLRGQWTQSIPIQIIYFVKGLKLWHKMFKNADQRLNSWFCRVNLQNYFFSFAGGFAGTPYLAVGLFNTCILQGASQAQGQCCTNPTWCATFSW